MSPLHYWFNWKALVTAICYESWLLGKEEFLGNFKSTDDSVHENMCI